TSLGLETSAATPMMFAPVASLISFATRSIVSCLREQMINDAPSAASSSATARPSPRLAAATSATLLLRPRSIGNYPQITQISQIGKAKPQKGTEGTKGIL